MQSDLIPLSAALKYIADRYGFKISRQTIYNWVKLGINGNQLEVWSVPAVGRYPLRQMTSRQAVDDFLYQVSPLLIEQARARRPA